MRAVRMSAVRIIIFAKAPQAGLAKTRLIPALGAVGAAQLARRMLEATLASALAADVGPVELCLTPAPDDGAWQAAGIGRQSRPAAGLPDYADRHRLPRIDA